MAAKKKGDTCYSTGRPLRGQPSVAVVVDGKSVGHVLLSEVKTALMQARDAERKKK